jgi:Mn2+/Fe2+ NRAMP family transporter
VALWRVKFETLERVFGLLGLALVVFVVGLIELGPDWGELARRRPPGPTTGENWATYGFFAVALFAAAMTPYEVFFFSSARSRSAGRAATWRPTGQRVRRLPARRAAVAGHHGCAARGVPARGSHVDSLARPRCRCRWRSASSGWPW